MTIAVVLRKAQHGVSIADEHDCERIGAYCRDLGSKHGIDLQVILPDGRSALDDTAAWGGMFFVGADDFARERIESAPAELPMFLWAKGYDLVIDARWTRALDAVTAFFNSSYLTGAEDPFNQRTHYVPTGFHEPWPLPARERLDDFRNRFVDVTHFDLVFSGSDRHVRSDRYRQRLLNLLVQRGLTICVAAPRSVWNRPRSVDSNQEVALDSSIRLLGNWGTARTFQRARWVLDLPWLDNYFPAHPSHHHPNESVFALGWNIFRAGAYGARVLTFDCPATRALGVTEAHCGFYQSGIADLKRLADEIVDTVGARRGDDHVHDTGRANLKALFHDRHTYRERWAFMCQTIAESYQAGSGTLRDGATHVLH